MKAQNQHQSFHAREIFKLKPILVGMALFNLMWMVVKEVSYRYKPFDGSHYSPGLYYDLIFLAFLLLIAALCLLLKRVWSQLIAIILSGFVVYVRLFWHFLKLAGGAEVPRFSLLHFRLWWPNLYNGQLLQIILACVLLYCSMSALIYLMQIRKKPTMSNNSFNRSAR